MSITPEGITPKEYKIAEESLANVPDATIPARLLINRNTDNLVPNPTSEAGALDGYEGALVVYDPSNAYAGDYCRKLDLSATNQTDLTPLIACFFGDQFTLEAQAKVSNSSGGIVFMLKFLDSAFAVITTVLATACTSTSYSPVSLKASAPAGTQYVQAAVKAAPTLAGAFGYADNLSMRRAVTADTLEAGLQSRVVGAYNRILNGGFFVDMMPWANPSGLVVANSPNGCRLTATANPGAVTKYASIYQSFSAPSTDAPVLLTYKAALWGGNAFNNGGSGYIHVTLIDTNAGTGVALDVWTDSWTGVPRATPTWVDRSVDITSHVNAGGDYLLAVEFSATSPAVPSGTCDVFTGMKAVKILI